MNTVSTVAVQTDDGLCMNSEGCRLQYPTLHLCDVIAFGYTFRAFCNQCKKLAFAQNEVAHVGLSVHTRIQKTFFFFPCRSKRENMEFCPSGLWSTHEESALSKRGCFYKWSTRLCLKGNVNFSNSLSFGSERNLYQLEYRTLIALSCWDISGLILSPYIYIYNTLLKQRMLGVKTWMTVFL
jgi:hypothetical protein